MKSPIPLSITLLAVQPRSLLANTLRDHIRALRSLSRHRVQLLQNYFALQGPRLLSIPRSYPLERFDVLIMHYSNYMAHPNHLDPMSIERIRSYRGLKVAFIQDEYRTVNATVDRLRYMKFDVLFTCVPEGEVEKVYPEERLPGLRKVSTLTGFIPDDLVKRAVPPIAHRPVDVGYRARVLPYWLGRLGAEKWQIARNFEAHTAGSGLRLDVSPKEEDRLYGERWVKFLLGCKAVLGVESGSSIFDFTGELQRDVDSYVGANPQATFEEVHELFLKGHEGKVVLNQISPRVFEAAALRTAMVLYEGEYSGVIKPGVHYISLKKDFSNIDEVVQQLRDTRGLQSMVDRTYREVALNPEYSYARFMELVDEVIEEEVERRGTARPGPMKAKDRLLSATSGRTTSAYFRARSFAHGLAYRLWVFCLPEKVRDILRPFVRTLLRRSTRSTS